MPLTPTIRSRTPCTRDTPRCPVRFTGPSYVRRACCTSHLLELTDFVHALFDEHGIFHWLDYGALLGAVREGTMIPSAPDVDFGILESDLDRVRSLRGEVERGGHAMITHDDLYVEIDLSDVNANNLDVFPWRREGDMITPIGTSPWAWPGMHERQAFPARYLDRLEPVELDGRRLPAPSPVHAFLRDHRYGPDYMVPTRRLADLGITDPVDAREWTDAALALLPLVRERSDHLVGILSSRSRLVRMGIAAPDGGSWPLVTGLPLEPERRHVEAAWERADPVAVDPAVAKLVTNLAWIERAIEEYEHPPSLARSRRMGRRLARIAGLARRRGLGESG